MNKKLLVFIIIFSIFLGGYLLYKYQNQPYMTIIIKYKEVPPVLQHFPRSRVNAYYRGYYVGQVDKIALSRDQQHILFYLNIYYKNLKLPKNIKIFLNSEDLYGSKHFLIHYPEKPSPELLSNGDIIDGTGYNYRLDTYLLKDLREGKTGHLISNLIVITDLLAGSINNKDTKELIATLKASGIDVGLILKDVKEILGDPQIKQSIKSSTGSIAELLKSEGLRDTIASVPESIDKTIRNLDSINKNLPKINKNLVKTNYTLPEVNENLVKTNQTLPEVNENLVKTNQTLPKTQETIETTNSLLGNTNCNLETINSKVPEIPPDLLKNADKTLKTADCLTCKLIDILSKRFLFFRFLFGNPASSLKKCKNCNCNE